MRMVFVVVADVFREQSFQLPFAHRYDVIQQIPAATLDPALCYTVLPRAFERSSHRRYPQGSNRLGNLDSILPVLVKYQKLGSRPERKRFPQLLNGPPARWMLRNIEVQNPSAVVGVTLSAIGLQASNRKVEKSY
jgi:hypothetical protein